MLTAPTSNLDLPKLGVEKLAQRLRDGEITSRQLTQACLDRIAEVQPHLRAMTVTLADRALADADKADRLLNESRSTGAEPPPLCGVPLTVKDCFDMVDTAATLGIASRAEEIAQHDCPLVSRLREAGAVVLGKTNIPQAMLLHCCDNPVFGRTLHPADPARGPGGSSGGEAAIVAAGGSVMGLGGDLGGSIRQPAHVCGLVGFKPTSGRLTNHGTHRGLEGMQAMAVQAGPIARSTEDAALMMRALVGGPHTAAESDEMDRPWRDYRQVDVTKLCVGRVITDRWFEPAPACTRAVSEATDALTQLGAQVNDAHLTDIDHAMQLYFGLASADGFGSVKRMLRGSKIDWQVRRQGWFAGLPRPARPLVALLLRAFGQRWLGKLMNVAGPRSADAYWRLTAAAEEYAVQFWRRLDVQIGHRVDALVLPAHPLPALRHGTALDLLPAASYCYLANLLGAPAGVTPWTQVRDSEQTYPHGAKLDVVDCLARWTMKDSAGLPVGVQVIARPWEDHVALALMAALEIE